MPLHKIIRFFQRIANIVRRRRESPNARKMRSAAKYIHESTELRINGKVTIGGHVNIGKYSVISVQTSGHLICDDYSRIGDNCEIDAFGTIRIGAHSSLQHRTILIGEVSIGAGCLFGPNIYISSGQHHFEDHPELPIRWQDARYYKAHGYVGEPVHIGEDCWFGTNVVIMPGVDIGRGCVIGANSTVTRDIPPYSIAAGSPARVLRARLSFIPPSELYADREEHMPYFYSGFRQWGNGISELKDALDNGGWFAKDHFSLAMAVEDGDNCELQLIASSPGMLKHGNKSIPVSLGESTIRFQASPNPYDILEFFWSGSQPGEQAGLVILHSKRCQNND